MRFDVMTIAAVTLALTSGVAAAQTGTTSGTARRGGTAARGTAARGAARGTAGSNKAKLMTPAQLNEKAPDLFKTRFDTSAGMVVIEVHREWAPPWSRPLLQPRQVRLLRRGPLSSACSTASWRSSG